MPSESRAGASARQSSVRVALVDDDEVIRTGVRGLLSSHRDQALLVGGVPPDENLEPTAQQLGADVVLTEVRPGGTDELEVVSRLASVEPPCKVVIYTYEDDVSIVLQAFNLGASGYLLKSLTGKELADTMVRIGSGEVVVDPTIATRIAMDAAQQADSESWPGSELGLSRRESEVTGLLVDGLNNRTIAAKLIIGEETVKTHLRKIYRKLGVHDRSQAVVRVLREGMFT